MPSRCLRHPISVALLAPACICARVRAQAPLEALGAGAVVAGFVLVNVGDGSCESRSRYARWPFLASCQRTYECPVAGWAGRDREGPCCAMPVLWLVDQRELPARNPPAHIRTTSALWLCGRGPVVVPPPAGVHIRFLLVKARAGGRALAACIFCQAGGG